MPPSKNEILYLLKVYSNGEATCAEEQRLFKWLNNQDDKDLIFKHIKYLIGEYKSSEIKGSVDWEMIYQNIVNKTE